MQPVRLGDLPADAVVRVERGERILEHQRDLVATDLAQLVGRQLRQLATAQQHLALDVGVGRQQTHHGRRADALARAGLADDRQRLTRRDSEVDAVDGRHQPAFRPEGDVKIVDFENRSLFRSSFGP